MKQMGSLDIAPRQMGDDFQDNAYSTTQMGDNDGSYHGAPNYNVQQQKPYTEAQRKRDEQARQMGCDL